MADLAPVAASVLAGSGSATESGTAGATIAQGDVIYKDATDSNKMKLAINSSEAAAAAKGIAINAASSGQPVSWVSQGTINLGVATAAGTTYVVSDNSGKIAPDADLGSGDYKTILGVGSTTANELILDINASGQLIP